MVRFYFKPSLRFIFFSQDPDENAFTVTSNTYTEMLNTIFPGDNNFHRWFQQDGVTAYTSLRDKKFG